ncbi:tail fiber assembly protein [Providencia rettgeri]|uniref:Bacteriophage tail assembly protein n=1 Tax=Providencia rettgeri TaxID=587 RepID=A0A379FLW3_PRORE|nr:tail fiber assembly protein [Providencia rettgeri]SUC29686.1 Bacteriophage tail assembly protein [Providencia rettgeri]
MKHYINKNTGDIFAYSIEQLTQVSRISELEVLLQEKEPDFITAGNKLEHSEEDLHDAKLALQQRITELSMDESIDIDSHDDVKLLVQNVDDKTAKYQESLISFEKTESEYQVIKSEYDGILPIFFDIQENLNSLTKMSKEEVDAYINPPISKEQLITEAEQQKQSLLAESNSAIAPLQDAVDLGMATDKEKAQLTAWKRYWVLLNRVDTSLAPDIDWPEKTSS